MNNQETGNTVHKTQYNKKSHNSTQHRNGKDEQHGPHQTTG
jgi:hypothetical protein